MCRNVSQRAVLDHIVDDSGHFDASSIVQYLGWFNNTHLPNVELICQCTSRKRLVTIASDWAENLSFLARLGEGDAELTAGARKQPPPSAVEADAAAAAATRRFSQPPDAVRVSRYDPTRTYVAIVVSDGDNLA